MKIYILAFALLCFALFSSAQNNYDKDWKSAAKLEKDGLIKSASKIINSIYTKAKAKNNKPQLIKALFHKSKYALVLQEDAQLNIVNAFKSEIEITKSIITKHLLENILATIYWQYFQQNRYKFYNRSKIEIKVSTDFRTWDLNTLLKEIHIYYQRSLKDVSVLQQKSLKDYDELLTTTENSKEYRPTLFDLIAHNALAFYKSDENTITQPSYKFSVDNKHYSDVGDKFINCNLQTKDSLSLQFNALKIYQTLMRVHQNDNSSKAFVSLDIERLKFVKRHATFSNKETLYLIALQKASNTAQGKATSGLYNFEIAKTYHEQAQRFNAKDKSTNKYRFKNKEAIVLCNAVIEKLPKTEAARNCEMLKRKILQPNLKLKAESYIPAEKPTLVLIDYNNVYELDIALYKISITQLETYNTIFKANERQAFFKQLFVDQKISAIKLKTEGDFQQHTTETVLPKLANGIYLVKATTKGGIYATASLMVTNMALTEIASKDVHHYQLINRLNGKPIANAAITFDYINDRNIEKTKQFTTDTLGKFQCKRTSNNLRRIKIKVVKGNETAYFGDYYVNTLHKPAPKNTSYNTFLFTDRSIYRPSQTVYFKGIATKTHDKKTKIIEALDITATLHNVNGESLKVIQLKSNEYGSFHGQFILPSGGLTGQYHIKTSTDYGKSSYHYFSVEEYKRPKFKPEFKPITGVFKVNDTIIINGKAMAYTGSSISNAKVVYRVKRNVRMPIWYHWRYPFYNSTPQEITFGQTNTDEKGEFIIPFKAIPDLSVSKENLPIFNYEVTADLTDINGETRSASTIVNVGYHSMTLNIQVSEQIDKTKDDFETTLTSKNLNNEFVPAKGKLTLYKLESPSSVLRPRPWEAPDYQVISVEEFFKLFPHTPYKDEANIKKWKSGKSVFNVAFNTEINKVIKLKPIKHLSSGVYKIVIEGKDSFGMLIKDEVLTTLYSSRDKTLADQQLFEVSLDKENYKPNTAAKVIIGSVAETISVTIEVEKSNTIISTEVVTLNNSKTTVNVPIKTNDVGGFKIHVSTATFNHYNTKTLFVNVPYPKTDLEITASTFRDKLQPGHDETWSFNIRGPKGDVITAEILASMYDTSLDQFKAHQWQFNPLYQHNYNSRIYKNYKSNFGVVHFTTYNKKYINYTFNDQDFDKLNWFGFRFGNADYLIPQSFRKVNTKLSYETEESENEITTDAFNPDDVDTKTQKKSKIQIRKNLQETAFFFPQLHTDTQGNVSFSFTSPEALTQWKLQLLAHTKDLKSSLAQFEIVTQKELMVLPNTPRFLRQGDTITISTKIANLTDKELSGVAHLELIDAVTGKNISKAIITSIQSASHHSGEISLSGEQKVPFCVDPKQNTQISWTLKIPEYLQAIQYKIIAEATNFSDGEQGLLPVLSNRMLVTETLAMWVGSNETKIYSLNNLATNTSKTLKNHKLTLEITSNPAWYTIKALPYLMEYPYKSNEQIFSQYYANALAQHIVISNPEIEDVFKQWQSINPESLLSNLGKNQELKSLLIEETPWLRDVQSETAQKSSIALLFNRNTIKNELQRALQKLKINQSASGGWSWFNAGHDNRFITQHIISGFGHLKQLDVNPNFTENSSIKNMIKKAVNFIDQEFIKAYKKLKKHNENIDLSKNQLSYMQLHYLYTRSFYPEISTSKEVKYIMNYYCRQIQKYWLNQSLYSKGLMVLTLNRMNDKITAGKILKSLKENSITSQELGMYWKANTNSWYWHQAPIETQALLIEAFAEAGTLIHNDIQNTKVVNKLKIWLLKHKQTNRWKTTKATTEAVYALLLQGSDWLSVSKAFEVTIGDHVLDLSKLDNTVVEAGTGYYKARWLGSEIKPKQAKVSLTKKGKGIAWGGLYWQYFEDLDKITPAKLPNGTQKHPLKLVKKLYLKTNTSRGEELFEITANSTLKMGDLVRVRIELSVDRAMEFIHLKDMRAAGLEPLNTLSKYKWQEGMGYYESTKDAATNFFIDFLPKGIYVFEYDLRVNNTGHMSNGLTTIQSMYAPAFSNHTKGVKVKVE